MKEKTVFLRKVYLAMVAAALIVAPSIFGFSVVFLYLKFI
jgi:hypothetical protein